jgi:hypothetical protein
MTVFAAIGAKALYLLYAWLLSAAISAYLSERKGYGQRPGLAAGLLLSLIGIVVWLAWPARPESKWKLAGPWGSKVKAERAAKPPAERQAEP